MDHIAEEADQLAITARWQIDAPRESVYAIASDFEAMPVHFPRIAHSASVVSRPGAMAPGWVWNGLSALAGSDLRHKPCQAIAPGSIGGSAFGWCGGWRGFKVQLRVKRCR